MHEAGQRQVELRVHVGQAGQAGGGERHAVVGVGAPDHDLLLRLAMQLPEIPDQLDHRVVGLGAGVREEHPVEPGRDRRQPRRQLDGGAVVHWKKVL